jgi:hypothetical protein
MIQTTILSSSFHDFSIESLTPYLQIIGYSRIELMQHQLPKSYNVGFIVILGHFFRFYLF